MEGSIRLKGVRTHNLKNIDVEVPHNRIVVVTGVSGSGKSSLAFDTLYAEGQRRYVESLSAYARQFLERMEKPDVETVTGILPALAIEAKNVIQNARSTVGTQTEINDYLRVLFARVGRTYCRKCGRIVESDRPEKIAAELISSAKGKQALILFTISLGEASRKYLQEYFDELEKQGFIRLLMDGDVVELADVRDKKLKQKELQVVVDRLEIDPEEKARLTDSIENAYRFGKGHARIRIGKEERKISESFHCAECDIEYKRPTPNTFSFNSPLGACPECQGFGRIITIDRNLVIPDESKSLKEGAIEPWTKPSSDWFLKGLIKYCTRNKIPLLTPYRELSEKHKSVLWDGDERAGFEGIMDFFEYLETKTYKMHVRVFLSKYRGYTRCPSCAGSRLKPEAMIVQVEKKNIGEVMKMTVKDLAPFFGKLDLTPHEKELAGPVLHELTNRIGFLNEVGLGYLTLDRLSRTLSGGEAQRINLATSLGSSLVDTLYVLDEPSIGLHERDNALLINIMKKLRDLGNTVVVVEHDRRMIEMADEIIDMGPFAGEKGGDIVFQGGWQALLGADTLTARYLSGREAVTRPARNPNGAGKVISIRGAKQHNLKNISLKIPLGKFVVLTGVSGSGKSTLLYDILYNHYQRFRGRPCQDLGDVEEIKGLEAVEDVVLVDQSPIGRTPRSNPITYIKGFDDIRKIFASSERARRLGLEASYFSFNVEGGRCDGCDGSGKIKVEMHFLADIYVECEKCEGKRFKKEVLDIRVRDKNIDDVLQMTFDEAYEFFTESETLRNKIRILQKIGLGYLRLGQSALTLSAGEAQRMKLAVEMADTGWSQMLYLFDEPTTGLHYHDIRFLMQAFWELLERGNSILVIEHNMDVIRAAEHIIDLGPEGGDGGGEVVFSGSMNELLAEKPKKSHTYAFLRNYLSETVSRASFKV